MFCVPQDICQRRYIYLREREMSTVISRRDLGLVNVDKWRFISSNVLKFVQTRLQDK